MPMATPEATGHHPHRATTRSASPRQPPGQQQTKKRLNVSTLLAVSMAVAVQGYYTAHIAQWRRFMDFPKATKCCHWASTHSDSINWTSDMPTPDFGGIFHHQFFEKEPMLASNNNRGMTHQSDEKHLNYMAEYFVGVVKVALYCYNTCFL